MKHPEVDYINSKGTRYRVTIERFSRDWWLMLAFRVTARLSLGIPLRTPSGSVISREDGRLVITAPEVSA